MELKYKHSCDFKYETFFKNLEGKGLKYFPWVGKNFDASEEKILIVGESVYNWGKNPDTIEIAQEKLDLNDYARVIAFEHGTERISPKQKFAENIEKAVSGKIFKNKEDNLEFWQNIAFHEFVQRPLKNIKIRPTIEDYKLGSKLLLDIIEHLKINKCIFLGTAWYKFSSIANNIEEKESKHFAYKINNSRPKVLHLLNKHQSKIYFIKHPSSYFSWEQWAEFLKNN